MLKFAERRNLSLEQVAAMPTHQQDLWMAWTAKEPSDAERIEFALARLCYMTAKVNSKKGANINLSDFLYKADWREPKKGHAQDMVAEFLKGFR